jgi:hypothetical protein
MLKNEDELEDWERFQMESDAVRNLILSYLCSKCEFKNISQSHRMNCEKYHEEEKRRRKPFKDGKLVYESELCQNIIQNKECKIGESCDQSHNLLEIIFHPAKYRTVLCDKNCNSEIAQKYCPFAHSQEQLRIGHIYLKIRKKSISKNENLNRMVEGTYDEFEVNTFKTVKCNMSMKHNEKQCLYYHSSKDRRRNPLNWNYISENCIYSESEKTCPHGDNCQKSHNKVELFYHPSKFKNKFCSHFNLNPKLNDIETCSYGKYCSFAHSENEIKIELIHNFPKNEEFFISHFKTVICPFTQTHEKSVCVYSHNWQDFRRNPQKTIYKNTSCNRWDNKKTILSYKDGCELEYKCNSCHGWKEEDFHPLNYKTKKCKNFLKNCSKKELCPFFHQNEVKRIIPITMKEDYKNKIKKREEEIKELKPLKSGSGAKEPANSNSSKNLIQMNSNKPNASNSSGNMVVLNTNDSNTNTNNKSPLKGGMPPNLQLNMNQQYLSYQPQQRSNKSEILNSKMLNNMFIQNYGYAGYNYNQGGGQGYNSNQMGGGIYNNNMMYPMGSPHFQNNPPHHHHNSFTISRPVKFMSNYSNPNLMQRYGSNSNFYSNNSFNNCNNSYNSFNSQRSFNNSDNEINLLNEIPKTNRSNYSSQFSSSSGSDNFSESFCTEGLGNSQNVQNPNDSMEFCAIGDKFDFTAKDQLTKDQFKGKKDSFKEFENLDIINENIDIDDTNNLVKQLLKETELNFNLSPNTIRINLNTSGNQHDSFNLNINQGGPLLSTNREDFMDYLYINKFLILYEKMKNKEIELKQLTSFSDDKILRFVEHENRPRFDELRSIIMKMDDDFNGDDLLKSIENFNSNFKYDPDNFNFDLDN